MQLKAVAFPLMKLQRGKKDLPGQKKCRLNALYIPEVIYRFLAVPMIRIYETVPTEQILYFFKTTQDADKICRINGQTT